MESRFKTAQQFCEGAFKWSRKFQWFGKTGVVALSGDRRVRLDLVTKNTHEQWEGFLLTLLDKNTGTILTKRMWFSDYMTALKNGCDSSTKVRVIEHCNWDWYGAPIGGTKPYTDAVEAFIKAFE